MNLDQLTNLDVKLVGRTAFKLVDKLQMEPRDRQLAGAALFFWALCKGLDVPPHRLMEAIDRCAMDADRKQVPSVGALVLYVKNELRGIAP
jgi:hypothetical protein